MSTRNFRQEVLATILLFITLLATSASSIQAAEFDYPELTVVPRASERLEMESKKQNRWLEHLPVQVSAASTLVSALSLRGDGDAGTDRDGYASLTGIVVGGGWLATTFALSSFYRPYSSALSDIRGMPSKSMREQLVRERMAEEAIESAAALAWKISILSAATNLGASIYIQSEAGDGSFAKTASLVSMATSLAPLVFNYHWIRVAKEQRSYKKKIYAPVASMIWGGDGLSPGMALSFSF